MNSGQIVAALKQEFNLSEERIYEALPVLELSDDEVLIKGGAERFMLSKATAFHPSFILAGKIDPPLRLITEERPGRDLVLEVIDGQLLVTNHTEWLVEKERNV